MKTQKPKKLYAKSVEDFDSTKQIDPSKPLNLDQVILLSGKRKFKTQVKN